MVTAALVLFIVSGTFGFIATLLIATQAFCKHKKILYFLFANSIVTLPASICNIITFAEYMPQHWNSFCYLFVSMFLVILHFWLSLDIGTQLRIDGIRWSHPIIIVGLVALCGTLICAVIQITVLFIQGDNYPLRPVFITGVVFAVISDGSLFFYSLSPLIHLKSKRIHENQSRTTAIGVWFLFIQFIWYAVYGSLYIWFFCMPWDKFPILLVFDYFLRYIQFVMYAFPPPCCVVHLMSQHFFSSLSTYNYTNDSCNGSTINAPLDSLKAKDSIRQHYSYSSSSSKENALQFEQTNFYNMQCK